MSRHMCNAAKERSRAAAPAAAAAKTFSRPEATEAFKVDWEPDKDLRRDVVADFSMCVPDAKGEYYRQFNGPSDQGWEKGCPLFDGRAKATDFAFSTNFAQFARLDPSLGKEPEWIYLNTKEPFAAVMVGVQGAGKSYTTANIIESCLIPVNTPENKLLTPLATLVCHFDESVGTMCEAASLTIGKDQSTAAVKQMVILTSPSNFFERKQTYSACPSCTVVPLLFDFKHLGAQELKQIMGVSADQSQLYMSVVLNVLRKWEKRPKTANIPQLTFEGFEKLLQNEQELTQSQSVPLQQRLSLLRSFLKDADENKDLPYDRDVSQFFVRGCVVIADLTDPLISQSDANRIFQVVLSLFRKTSLDPSSSEPAAKLSGKLVVFDEAHKYISCKSGDLCDDVVYLVRQMRHYGIRIVVSTQVTFRIRTQHANNTDE